MCFSDILTHLRSLNYALNVEIFTKEALLTKLTLKLFNSFVGQVKGPNGENCCHDYTSYQVIVTEYGPRRVHEAD